MEKIDRLYQELADYVIAHLLPQRLSRYDPSKFKLKLSHDQGTSYIKPSGHGKYTVVLNVPLLEKWASMIEEKVSGEERPSEIARFAVTSFTTSHEVGHAVFGAFDALERATEAVKDSFPEKVKMIGEESAKSMIIKVANLIHDQIVNHFGLGMSALGLLERYATETSFGELAVYLDALKKVMTEELAATMWDEHFQRTFEFLHELFQAASGDAAVASGAISDIKSKYRFFFENYSLKEAAEAFIVYTSIKLFEILNLNKANLNQMQNMLSKMGDGDLDKGGRSGGEEEGGSGGEEKEQGEGGSGKGGSEEGEESGEESEGGESEGSNGEGNEEGGGESEEGNEGHGGKKGKKGGEGQRKVGKKSGKGGKTGKEGKGGKKEGKGSSSSGGKSGPEDGTPLRKSKQRAVGEEGMNFIASLLSSLTENYDEPPQVGASLDKVFKVLIRKRSVFDPTTPDVVEYSLKATAKKKRIEVLRRVRIPSERRESKGTDILVVADVSGSMGDVPVVIMDAIAKLISDSKNVDIGKVIVVAFASGAGYRVVDLSKMRRLRWNLLRTEMHNALREASNNVGEGTVFQAAARLIKKLVEKKKFNPKHMGVVIIASDFETEKSDMEALIDALNDLGQRARSFNYLFTVLPMPRQSNIIFAKQFTDSVRAKKRVMLAQSEGDPKRFLALR